MTGCNKHRLDSIDKFTNFLPALDTGFMERDEFKEFYKVSVKAHTLLDLDGQLIVYYFPISS